MEVKRIESMEERKNRLKDSCRTQNKEAMKKNKKRERRGRKKLVGGNKTQNVKCPR